MNEALKSALSHFKQRNGEICVASKPITEIVKEHPTPLYIYDRSVLLWRHKTLREALPDELKIYYAVKANPNIEIIRELGRLYDGLDIASKGEMIKALEARVAPERMSFAGPGKSLQELEFAIENDIGNISVESEREIAHINLLGRELNKQVRILIRVNPKFELVKSGVKMGGGPTQFGVDEEQIPSVVESLHKMTHLKFEGIHIYNGSQNLSASAILETFQRIIDYAMELTRRIDYPITTVNLGGGFGIPYFATDRDLDLQQIGSGLTKLMASCRKHLPNTKFMIELGRFIVGECGLYVCEVLYRKISRNEVFLILNGGMNHHLAASGNLGQSFHRPMPLIVANKLNAPLENANVVGPLCTPIDKFGMNVELPKAEGGDFVVVMNSGAYGYSASPIGFLSHKPPQEVVI